MTDQEIEDYLDGCRVRMRAQAAANAKLAAEVDDLRQQLAFAGERKLDMSATTLQSLEAIFSGHVKGEPEDQDDMPWWAKVQVMIGRLKGIAKEAAGFISGIAALNQVMAGEPEWQDGADKASAAARCIQRLKAAHAKALAEGVSFEQLNGALLGHGEPCAGTAPCPVVPQVDMAFAIAEGLLASLEPKPDIPADNLSPGVPSGTPAANSGSANSDTLQRVDNEAFATVATEAVRRMLAHYRAFLPADGDSWCAACSRFHGIDVAHDGQPSVPELPVSEDAEDRIRTLKGQLIHANEVARSWREAKKAELEPGILARAAGIAQETARQYGAPMLGEQIAAAIKGSGPKKAE